MTVEAVVFPDSLEFVSTYLKPNLAAQGFHGADVHSAPAPKGSRLEVWLQRDGGPVLDIVRETVRLRVNCFADDPGRIIPLSQTVSALLMACRTGPVIRVDRPSGPILITPSVKPQTLQTFELTVRGVPLNPS